jgi:hypothetical protein
VTQSLAAANRSTIADCEGVGYLRDRDEWLSRDSKIDVRNIGDNPMRNVKNRGRRSDLVSRHGRITSCHAGLWVRADRPRGLPACRKSRTSIHLAGELTEPIGEVTRFMFQIDEEKNPSLGNSEVPSVGAFISIKPELQGVVTVSKAEFQQLLMLAASGRLEWCFVSFTPPLRRSALIVSIDFSTRPPSE